MIIKRNFMKEPSRQRGLFFMFTVLIILASILKVSKGAEGYMVRVLIAQDSQNVYIAGGGIIDVRTGNGRFIGSFPANDSSNLKFSPVPSGIRINDEQSNERLLILSSKGTIPIKTGRYAYRGEILINLNNHSELEVINRLGLEDYLKGLMKSEISPAWPLESLKAQAVVARTYTHYQKNRNKNSSYDLNASTEFQVYIGILGEDPRTNDAVDFTKGTVLIWNNDYLPALYHACCGGHTEDAKSVFNDHPCLIGVPCGFCSESPHYEWETQISFIKLRNLFLREYFRMGPIKSIQIMEKTPYERVEIFLITHSLGQEIINGTQLRALIGHEIIRSTLLSPVNLKDSVVFKGKGWGHGVGLCQWGAKAMAEQGASYREILNHYYPRATLKNS